MDLWDRLQPLLAALPFFLLAWGIYWQRRRSRPDRAANANAGIVIAGLVEGGRTFFAQASADGSNCVVEVDGRRAVVVFRNVDLVRGFVGNRIMEIMEVPFGEILGIEVLEFGGGADLCVRTTSGRVTVKGIVEPFKALCAILEDIGEVNRADPAKYAAAVAREPKIRTTWVGWLILAAAVGAVAYVGWKSIYAD